MQKKANKIANWVKARFLNVWTDKYPWYFHIIDFLVGFALALSFVITYESSLGIKIGLFFAILPIGYLITLAFTYGILRARNAWSKKRK